MNNALTIFDMLLGGAQPTQGQPSAGAGAAGSVDGGLPFDVLMQQLLGGKQAKQSGQNRLPFVVAPNPTQGQNLGKQNPPKLQPNPSGQQHGLQGMARGGVQSVVSPELLMRQLLNSGKAGQIDFNPQQQVALERSATDGHVKTVSVESLIAQAGFVEDGKTAKKAVDQPEATDAKPNIQQVIGQGEQKPQTAQTQQGLQSQQLLVEQQANEAAGHSPREHFDANITSDNRPAIPQQSDEPVTVDMMAAKQAARNFAFPTSDENVNTQEQVESIEQNLTAEQLPRADQTNDQATNQVAVNGVVSQITAEAQATVPTAEATVNEANEPSISPRVHLASIRSGQRITAEAEATVPTAEATVNEADEPSIDPRVHLASIRSGQQITVSQPTRLTPGTYEVVDFNVRNDRVQFTLTPVEHGKTGASTTTEDTQKLKISLPQEVVQKALDAALGQPRQQPVRVQLDGLNQPVRRMEAILQQLNVQKIEVSAPESDSLEMVQPKAQNAESRQIQLTLTPDKAQQPVRVDVSSNKVHAVSEQRVSMESSPRVAVSEPSGSSTGGGQSFGQQAGGQDDEFAGMLDRQMTSGGFKLNATSESGSNNRFEQLLGLQSQGDRPTSMPSADMPESRPVRMVIPEAEMMKLRTTGQTVRLRLEPDSLGPARLTLHMQGDTMKAHVVVESQQARAAVESSLQELAQQLNRANIKVDHISVEVASDGTDQQWQFDRRPNWHARPQGGSYANLNAEGEDDETIDNPTILAQADASRGYGVGAGGVNLLA
jgi:flagellar hook-length control protein FliK